MSGTWHTLYLDGVQVAQNLSGGNVFASYQTITNTVIGAQTTLAQAFQGTIGDVRVYNYAIPQTLVTSLYRDRELVVYYPFDTSVNSLTPNYATLVYDASLIGQATVTSSGANVGSGALALTNSATTPATQYVKTTPGIAGQVGWKLDVTHGITIACWINVAGVAGRIQRIFDIPLSVGTKGLAVDISGTNMVYSGWNLILNYLTLSAVNDYTDTANVAFIDLSGGYVIYDFNTNPVTTTGATSTTFTVKKTLTGVNLLLIGGGGGGASGARCGSGGGAGGCVLYQNQTIAPGTYTLSVGAGASGQTATVLASSPPWGTGTGRGYDTSTNLIPGSTPAFGGGRGSYYTGSTVGAPPNDGGSGGGGNFNMNGYSSLADGKGLMTTGYGQGTTGQGYAGGSGDGVPNGLGYFCCAGGGGAGGVGGNGIVATTDSGQNFPPGGPPYTSGVGGKALLANTTLPGFGNSYRILPICGGGGGGLSAGDATACTYTTFIKSSSVAAYGGSTVYNNNIYQSGGNGGTRLNLGTLYGIGAGGNATTYGGGGGGAAGVYNTTFNGGNGYQGTILMTVPISSYNFTPNIVRSQLGPIDYLSASAKASMLNAGPRLSAGAYGTQLLYSSYTGPVMKLRRSTDSSNVDFYADIYGNLGTTYLATGTTLNNWLSGNSATVVYVTTWYDQTGNANHGTGAGTTLPFYNTTTKEVDFGTVGYFTLIDGSYPSGNSAYSYLYKQGRIDTTKSNVVYGGGSIPGVSNSMAVLFLDNTNSKYTDSWYSSNYTRGTVTAGDKIATTYNGINQNGQKMYINNVAQTAQTGTVTRAQTTTFCYLGSSNLATGTYPTYNSTMPYFYWAPVQLNPSDINILGSTGATPVAYYPFDTSFNSLSPNIANNTIVYDFSLNSNATITVPPTTYPFLNTGALYISSRIGAQAGSSPSTEFSIAKIPSNISVSYTVTMWFNLTNIVGLSAILSTRNSIANVGVLDNGTIMVYTPANASNVVLYTGSSGGSAVNSIANSGTLTYANAGWYFFSMTLNSTSATVSNVNLKIISSNNTNTIYNVNSTTSKAFSGTILPPRAVILGDQANGFNGLTSLGYYCNFQFYNSPLTQPQIMNLYYNNSATLNTVNNYSVNITYNFVNIAANPAVISRDAVMNVFLGANAAFSVAGTTPNSEEAISVTNTGIYTIAATTQTFQSAVTTQNFGATTNFCMGPTLPTTNKDIFNFGGTPNTGTSYRFYITSTGVLTGAAGATYTTPVDFSTLVTNTWYHIAVSFNTTGFTLYLNGVAQTPTSGSAAVTGISGFTSVGLGYSATTTYRSYYNYWKYFGYTLSASDITTIYASDYTTTVATSSTTPILQLLFTSTTVTNTGSLSSGITSGVTVTAGSFINGPNGTTPVYRIAGSSNTLNNFGNLQNFTVTWWEYNPNVSTDATLIFLGNGSTRMFGTNSVEGNMGIYSNTFSTTGVKSTEVNVGTVPFSAATWQLNTLSFSNNNGNGTGSIYKNGNLINTFSYTNYINPFNNFLFFPAPANFFYIYKLNVFNTTLTQPQILDLFNAK